MNNILKQLLAKQGRYGDSTLRNVGGQLSHVNPREASIIDRLGSTGEKQVLNRGAGTINPVTGLPEYYGHWSGGYMAHHGMHGQGAGTAGETQTGIGDVGCPPGTEPSGAPIFDAKTGTWQYNCVPVSDDDGGSTYVDDSCPSGTSWTGGYDAGGNKICEDITDIETTEDIEDAEDEYMEEVPVEGCPEGFTYTGPFTGCVEDSLLDQGVDVHQQCEDTHGPGWFFNPMSGSCEAGSTALEEGDCGLNQSLVNGVCVDHPECEGNSQYNPDTRMCEYQGEGLAEFQARQGDLGDFDDPYYGWGSKLGDEFGFEGFGFNPFMTHRMQDGVWDPTAASNITRDGQTLEYTFGSPFLYNEQGETVAYNPTQEDLNEMFGTEGDNTTWKTYQGAGGATFYALWDEDSDDWWRDESDEMRSVQKYAEPATWTAAGNESYANARQIIDNPSGYDEYDIKNAQNYIDWVDSIAGQMDYDPDQFGIVEATLHNALGEGWFEKINDSSITIDDPEDPGTKITIAEYVQKYGSQLGTLTPDMLAQTDIKYYDQIRERSLDAFTKKNILRPLLSMRPGIASSGAHRRRLDELAALKSKGSRNILSGLYSDYVNPATGDVMGYIEDWKDWGDVVASGIET